MDLGHEDRWEKGDIVQLCSPPPGVTYLLPPLINGVLSKRGV